MVFHPETKQLLVLGGNRNKEPMPHFLAYDIYKNVVIKMATSGAPEMALTQRAVLDTDSNSLLVLSNIVARPLHRDQHQEASVKKDAMFSLALTGITFSGSTGSSSMSSAAPLSPNNSQGTCLMRPTLWMYRLHSGTWQKLPCGARECNDGIVCEPRPRYAHQVSYNPRTKAVFMFGGNPDLKEATSVRLDDFWELQLYRPSLQDIIRQCRLLIRKQRYVARSPTFNSSVAVAPGEGNSCHMMELCTVCVSYLFAEPNVIRATNRFHGR
jgi:hypothetical protein